MSILQLVLIFVILLPLSIFPYSIHSNLGRRSTQLKLAENSQTPILPTQTDIVIIGAGLAGLSCGALLANAGYKVTVLESHDTPGGCCHTWERQGYHFESGPSLYSGFSIDKSPNPLKNIFQIIEEEPEWITYDRWGTAIPEGKFAGYLILSNIISHITYHISYIYLLNYSQQKSALMNLLKFY